MTQEFYGKKVTFSISIDMKTLIGLKDLHEKSYRGEKFSQFVQHIIKLGIAKGLEIQAKQSVFQQKTIEDMVAARLNDKKTPKRIVTKKVKG